MSVPGKILIAPNAIAGRNKKYWIFNIFSKNFSILLLWNVNERHNITHIKGSKKNREEGWPLKYPTKINKKINIITLKFFLRSLNNKKNKTCHQSEGQ